ncbi:MAG: BirA family transcriptional regulator [Actinomycetota bacterium]|jgi:BirA family biotin operon repressor/biotin-[acetyl-CoA-carboxylase] ligase|nr:BirA family transcriptional regulator [Actinomycetota bacterium]
MADDLSAPLVKAALKSRFGEFVRYFDEIDSTNREALDWAACGAPEGSLVVADHQTGGRGRWGRSWFSAPGQLLQFSLILRPNIEPTRHGALTAGLGVATARAVRALTGLPVEVKWPNDVVIEGRKLAGMLVESTMMGSTIDAAICGIGINVHLQNEEIPEELVDRATSIAIELQRTGTGTAPPRALLLSRVVSEIEARYAGMTGDTGLLLAEATEMSAVLGHDVVIRAADGSTIEGRAEGFDPHGALRISSNGKETVVHVGEIEQLRTSDGGR